MAERKDTHYAWTPIKVGDADGNIKYIKPGEKVKPSDLEHGDTDYETATFDQFVESGAVRPYEYPDMPDTANLQSPIDFMRNQALASAQSEEERLMATMGEEVTRASIGPVTEPIVLPEEVEQTEEKK